MKYFVLIGRIFIGVLFIYASFYKLLEPASFAVSVRNYMLLPAAYSNIVALTLPWVEFAVGIFLILGIQTRPSALLTTGMLAVFLFAIIYAYTIGLDIDCGCFGSATESKGRIGIYHIFRDSFFFLISLSILLFDRGDFALRSLLSQRTSS